MSDDTSKAVRLLQVHEDHTQVGATFYDLSDGGKEHRVIGWYNKSLDLPFRMVSIHTEHNEPDDEGWTVYTIWHHEKEHDGYIGRDILIAFSKHETGELFTAMGEALK